MRRFALLVAASLALTACQTSYPYYTSERPRPEARPGAAGTSPQPRPHGTAAVRRPPPSGPVGVLAENMVGPYMDDQEMALRQRLREVRVARIGNDIVLNLRSDILFRSNSRQISSEAAATIERVAAVLRRYDKTLIEVNGYTDTSGSADYNLKLSQARAEAVADELVNDGINPARISPRGYGETHLRIPTGDNVSEPRNRRVEIRILPHVVAQG